MIKHTPATVRETSVLTAALPSKNLEFSSEMEPTEKEKKNEQGRRENAFSICFLISF